MKIESWQVADKNCKRKETGKEAIELSKTNSDLPAINVQNNSNLIK